MARIGGGVVVVPVAMIVPGAVFVSVIGAHGAVLAARRNSVSRTSLTAL